MLRMVPKNVGGAMQIRHRGAATERQFRCSPKVVPSGAEMKGRYE